MIKLATSAALSLTGACCSTETWLHLVCADFRRLRTAVQELQVFIIDQSQSEVARMSLDSYMRLLQAYSDYSAESFPAAKWSTTSIDIERIQEPQDWSPCHAYLARSRTL